MSDPRRQEVLSVTRMTEPVLEGEGELGEVGRSNSSSRGKMMANVLQWVKGARKKQQRQRSSDPDLFLGVLGCPLSPVAVVATSLPYLSIKDTIPIEASSAQYIVQQYMAATGSSKLRGNSIRNSYITGKVHMLITEFETASRIVRNPMKTSENGWFVLWQMMPSKWYLELSMGDSFVQAASDGKLVWRAAPWLHSHAAKGPARPLRRLLQGLDPMTIASLFANAQCIGEKKMGLEDCFILRLAADPLTLSARSDGQAETVRHMLFGYFSQRSGLLVHLADSHLTRIQAANESESVYWETTIESSLEEYKAVDGIALCHAGRSVVTLFRFGEESMSHTKTRMEETWSIQEVAFNVPSLSSDLFAPPPELKKITTAPCHFSEKPNQVLHGTQLS